MNRRALQFTLRQMTPQFQLQSVIRPRLFITFMVVVLLCTLTGPFETAAKLNLPQRFLYWLCVQAGAWAMAIALSFLADFLLKDRIRQPLGGIILGAAAAGLPIGLWVILINHFVWGSPISFSAILIAGASAAPFSVLFCILAYLTTYGGRTLPAPTGTVKQPAPTAPASGLLARLNPGLRGDILRLSAEDHYTSVTTSRGRQLVLMRFSDALQEVSLLPGMQIHRSHWIADRFVTQLKRIDGALYVVTTDGAQLPISRSRQKEARKRHLAEVKPISAGTAETR